MILDELVTSSKEAVRRRRALVPRDVLEERAMACPRPLSLVNALKAPGVSIIAEVKRASPSRGTLGGSLDAADTASRYALAGAAAISVLTEETHFKGNLQDLADAREGLSNVGLSVPLLYKGFVTDEYQLLEARAWGADGVLLIVAALPCERLGGLYHAARSLGLMPLVEVHSRDELARALAIDAAIIGINNRDLRTFQVDLGLTARLREHVPADRVLVSESGIRSPEDVAAMAALAVDAVLVGEALVTAGDLAAALKAMVEAGR